MMREIVTGQVVATGDDQEVELGFTPDYVRLINMNRVDAASVAQHTLEYFGDMDGYNIAHKKIEDTDTDGNDAWSIEKEETNYITPLASYSIEDDDNTHANDLVSAPNMVYAKGKYGFNIPGNFTANEDVLYYIAIRH